MSGGGDSSTPPTGDGAGKLQNPFAKDKEGFLSFSSSTPQASNPGSGGGGPRGGRGNFVPRRGKINRLNNWERFGDFVADGDNRPFQHSRPSGDSPSRGGMNYPNKSPRGFYSPHGPPARGFQGGQQFRGSPGQYRGSPGQFRGSPGQFRGSNNYRGGNQHQHQQHQPHYNQQQSPAWNRGGYTPRGRGGQNASGGQSYFHPSMLENPWSDLMTGRRLGQANKNSQRSSNIGSNNDSNLSDSLCAQAGCSILERSAINPAPDVTDNAEEEYSSGGEEEGTVPSPGGADYDEESRESPLNELDISTASTVPSVSDSMIPMIGDSIVAQDLTNTSIQ